MKKISNDDTFENYVGKFIDMNINGTIRKFYVSNIDSGSITTNAGILYPDSFSILRESPEQGCNLCDDPCVDSVPIIELNFYGKAAGYVDGTKQYLTRDRVNELHDVFVNNHKICRIDTNTMSAGYNRLWLIPYHSSNVQIPNFFDDQYDTPIHTVQASCVFFNPSFYNSKDWNSLVIIPISAYNPNTIEYTYPPQTFFTNFYGYIGPNAYSFHRTEPDILTSKIILSSTGVSAVSCRPWQQYPIGQIQNFDNFSCYPVDCPYLSTSIVSGSYNQQISTFFVDLNPCQNPTEYSLGFTYDADRYYTDTNQFIRMAYESVQSPDPYFGAPALRKYIFYTDCSMSNTIELYNGKSNVTFYSEPRWYSDLGLTLFTGTFYRFDPPYNDVHEVQVVEGSVISDTICP